MQYSEVDVLVHLFDSAVEAVQTGESKEPQRVQAAPPLPDGEYATRAGVAEGQGPLAPDAGQEGQIRPTDYYTFGGVGNVIRWIRISKYWRLLTLDVFN